MYHRLLEMYEKGYLMQKLALCSLSPSAGVSDRQALSCVFFALYGILRQIRTHAPGTPLVLDAKSMTTVFDYNYLLFFAMLKQTKKRSGSDIPVCTDATRLCTQAVLANLFVHKFFAAFKNFEENFLGIPADKAVMSRCRFTQDTGGLSDDVHTLWCSKVHTIDVSSGESYSLRLREAPTTNSGKKYTLCAYLAVFHDADPRVAQGGAATAASPNAAPRSKFLGDMWQMPPGGISAGGVVNLEKGLYVEHKARFAEVFYLFVNPPHSELAT
jgi:hypothetical protein